jgi:DNA replication initiation complex subunit (GINS family)
MPPDSIRNVMHPSMTPAEQELMQSVEDTIVESAEVTGYNLLIQMAGKMNEIDDAIPSLRQSLSEEEKMFTWLRANAPAMFAKLWPEIEESSANKEQKSKTNSSAAAESIVISATFRNHNRNCMLMAYTNLRKKCPLYSRVFNYS